MNTEMKHRLAEPVRDFRLPRYSEIPNVGLYLEQTTKYINSYLTPLGCPEVTASMVSNYVKKGLIPNPVKKQYNSAHIAYLFFVVIVKNLVAIEDIALLIQMQQSSYPLPVAYNYFCVTLENALGYIFGLTDSIEKRGKTQSDEKDILFSLVYSAANVIHLHACFNAIRNEEKGAAKIVP